MKIITTFQKDDEDDEDDAWNWTIQELVHLN